MSSVWLIFNLEVNNLHP